MFQSPRLLSGGTGFPVAIDRLAAVSDTAGWNKAQYDTTLQLGDVDGDGRADLCGRASTGWMALAMLGLLGLRRRRS